MIIPHSRTWKSKLPVLGMVNRRFACGKSVDLGVVNRPICYR